MCGQAGGFVAVSYEAKSYGIRKGDGIGVSLCTHLVLWIYVFFVSPNTRGLDDKEGLHVSPFSLLTLWTSQEGGRRAIWHMRDRLSLDEARKQCPGLVVLNMDTNYYRSVTDRLERASSQTTPLRFLLARRCAPETTELCYCWSGWRRSSEACLQVS